VMVRQQWVRLSQPAGPGDGVSLTIQTELSDEQTDRLLAELEQLTDDPERCVYSAVSSGGRTVIAVRPVADVQRFAERLSFAVNPQVDVDMRTINVSALRDR
jgi:Fe-S-cluster formation regulator IscX/YfhJ